MTGCLVTGVQRESLWLFFCFLDNKGILLTEFLDNWNTVNDKMYNKTLYNVDELLKTKVMEYCPIILFWTTVSNHSLQIKQFKSCCDITGKFSTIRCSPGITPAHYYFFLLYCKQWILSQKFENYEMKKMLLGYVKHCQDNFLSQNVEASGTVSEMLKYSYGQHDNVHGLSLIHI